jgi:hypothetical protein
MQFLDGVDLADEVDSEKKRCTHRPLRPRHVAILMG